MWQGWNWWFPWQLLPTLRDESAPHANGVNGDSEGRPQGTLEARHPFPAPQSGRADAERASAADSVRCRNQTVPREIDLPRSAAAVGRPCGGRNLRRTPQSPPRSTTGIPRHKNLDSSLQLLSRKGLSRRKTSRTDPRSDHSIRVGGVCATRKARPSRKGRSLHGPLDVQLLQTSLQVQVLRLASPRRPSRWRVRFPGRIGCGTRRRSESLVMRAAL